MIHVWLYFDTIKDNIIFTNVLSKITIKINKYSNILHVNEGLIICLAYIDNLKRGFH